MSGQQSSLPEIIVWMQALSVPILGMFAAWIAYQQWRTAERKVQLDLFDRRFAIYDAARQALYPVMREGGVEGREIAEFRMATDKAYLLFGPEVIQEIEEVAKALGALMVATSNMKSGQPYDPKYIQSKYDNCVRVDAFFTKMPSLIEPYMALAHKPPAPSLKLKLPWRSNPERRAAKRGPN